MNHSEYSLIQLVSFSKRTQNKFQNFKMTNILILLVTIGLAANAFAVRQESCLLGPEENCRYVMGFDPDLEKKVIVFDVKVATLGYVGFGLAPKAGMNNADIVIGGVKDGGEQYFDDYHGTGTTMPTRDALQDWNLMEANQTATHTYLKFNRSLETCDTDDDNVISSDTINIIWSFGETDDIMYHGGSTRGGRQFMLLDPPPAFSDVSQFDIHEIRVNNSVPNVKTSYLCSFHKFPQFENQKYLVGVEAFLENDDAVRHTHHFSVTTCRMDDVSKLEQLVADTKDQGKDCFEELLYMRPYCNEVLFGWAVGGKRVMLPDHVGIPFGEASSEGDSEGSLYIMLEVHYENPTEREDVVYQTGFDTYYTDVKRQYEGSIIMIGHEVNPALLIPPQSENYVVTGHCSSAITQATLPKEGVKVIAVNMHSHIAGREIRVRHYRNGQELPWLLNDRNYDFDYQQTRELRKEITLLPGDHLVNECVFNTMDRYFVTMGGESTFEEMCHTYLVYYPRSPLRGCKSHYPLDRLFRKFGIEKIQLTDGNLFNPTILAPERMKNQLFSEVLNALHWTQELRDEVQHDLRYGLHKAFMAAGDFTGQNDTALLHNFGNPESYGAGDETLPVYTKYPVAANYVEPEGNCNTNIGVSLLSSFKIILATLLLIAFNIRH